MWIILNSLPKNTHIGKMQIVKTVFRHVIDTRKNGYVLLSENERTIIAKIHSYVSNAVWDLIKVLWNSKWIKLLLEKSKSLTGTLKMLPVENLLLLSVNYTFIMPLPLLVF